MRNPVVYFHNKITGVNYSEFLSQCHFYTFFIGVNLTFFGRVLAPDKFPVLNLNANPT